MTTTIYHEDDHDDHGHDHSHETGKAEYIRLGLMARWCWRASLAGGSRRMSRDWLAFAATLIGGFPIFREAWENLRKRRMTMELSMTIALVGALCIGQFFTALVIAFFVIFAELLEGFTVGGGRRAIRELIDSLPRSVTVRRGARSVSWARRNRFWRNHHLRAGRACSRRWHSEQRQQFRGPGVDHGRIAAGRESEGSSVFAGTINKDGVLEVNVERIGRDTTFGKIIEIVEQAEKSKAPVQRVADRLAAGLVYFALGAAILTFIVTRNLTSTIAVIIVAGACGVAAGTPLAILAGIGSAARRGIIIKGGLYLEQLNTIDTVVLDKTGTLTLGVPRIMAITPLNGAGEEVVLQTAAIAEQHSEHPLGEAIVRSARGAAVARICNDSLSTGKRAGLCGGGEILVGSTRLLEEHGVTIATFSCDRETSRTYRCSRRMQRLLSAASRSRTHFARRPRKPHHA